MLRTPLCSSSQVHTLKLNPQRWLEVRVCEVLRSSEESPPAKGIGASVKRFHRAALLPPRILEHGCRTAIYKQRRPPPIPHLRSLFISNFQTSTTPSSIQLWFEPYSLWYGLTIAAFTAWDTSDAKYLQSYLSKANCNLSLPVLSKVWDLSFTPFQHPLLLSLSNQPFPFPSTQALASEHAP